MTDGGNALPILLMITVGISCIVFFQFDNRDLKTGLWRGFQICFLSVLLVFGVKWLKTYFMKIFSSQRRTNQAKSEDDEAVLEANRKLETRRCWGEIQKQHTLKAQSYKERILTPREEARKAKKEEEFRRFMGPAWKGAGQALGGEERSRSVVDEGSGTDGRSAAEFRQLPVPATSTAPVEQSMEQTRLRKKIVLPDEPSDDEEGCILVILKSPVNTVHQRRFGTSHTLQVLLNYMTTLGYSPRRYSLVTSYPREMPTEQDKTLAQLGFHRRIVLNIEALMDE